MFSMINRKKSFSNCSASDTSYTWSKFIKMLLLLPLIRELTMKLEVGVNISNIKSNGLFSFWSIDDSKQCQWREIGKTLVFSIINVLSLIWVPLPKKHLNLETSSFIITSMIYMRRKIFSYGLQIFIFKASGSKVPVFLP